MHSTRGQQTTFFHNGDFSGPVLFTASAVAATSASNVAQQVELAAPFAVLAHAATSRDDQVVLTARGDGGSAQDPYAETRYQVTLAVADLRQLVATRIRTERIGWLEQAEVDDILRLADTGEVAQWSHEGHAMRNPDTWR